MDFLFDATDIAEGDIFIETVCYDSDDAKQLAGIFRGFAENMIENYEKDLDYYDMCSLFRWFKNNQVV